jgi:hypothetical protein
MIQVMNPPESRQVRHLDHENSSPRDVEDPVAAATSG